MGKYEKYTRKMMFNWRDPRFWEQNKDVYDWIIKNREVIEGMVDSMESFQVFYGICKKCLL